MYVVFGDYSGVDKELSRFSDRYGVIHGLLLDNGLGKFYEVLRSFPANLNDYKIAHTEEYVSLLRKVCESRESIGGVTAPIINFEKIGVGGTLAATRIALEKKDIAYHVGGGYHHGMVNNANGIDCCNDVAIALRYMLTEAGLKRILYIDLDAHHPDGVQQIIDSDPRVFQISLHQWVAHEKDAHYSKIGQGEGVGKTINMPLPQRTGDSAYLQVLEALLRSVVKQYDPEAVFYQAGVDSHRLDPIGRLALSMRGLYERDVLVSTLFMQQAIPRIVVLGGGYNKEKGPQAVVNTLAALAGLPIVFNEACSVGAPIMKKLMRWYKMLQIQLSSHIELESFEDGL